MYLYLSQLNKIRGLMIKFRVVTLRLQIPNILCIYNISAFFIDLSKAFDTLNHDLLIAKLEAYGFSVNSLSYIHSYLNKRLQKTNVNNN